MSGKGDAPRPYSVDQETFASNWEAIFDKKNDGPRLGANPASKAGNDSSILSGPAISETVIALARDLVLHGISVQDGVTGERIDPRSIYIDPATGA